MSVRLGLLGLISQKPRHGYDLHHSFMALVGGQQNWEVKKAQIYTTLARLEKSGLIVKDESLKEGGPEKTIFSITEKGENILTKWLSEATPTEHQRDEFYLKLMISLATSHVDPYALMYKQRDSLYKELHRINVEKLKMDKTKELALHLLMEQASMRIEADLRWLDMVEARLDEIRSQPMPQPEVKHRGRPVQKKEKEDNQ